MEHLSKETWVSLGETQSKCALHSAMESRADLDLVTQLIEHGADESKETTGDDFSPLTLAVNRGQDYSRKRATGDERSWDLKRYRV